MKRVLVWAWAVSIRIFGPEHRVTAWVEARAWKRILLSSLAVLLLTAGSPRENLSRWLRAEAAKMPVSRAPEEGDEERRERVATIAGAVAEAALPYGDGRGWTASELAAAVLVLMNEETRFDYRVHAGLTHPVWTQDVGRAKCLGQLHTSLIVPLEVWTELAGVGADRTLACAKYTTLVLVRQARQCGVWYGRRADVDAVAKAFAAYGTGGKCVPSARNRERAEKWGEVIKRRFDRPLFSGYRRATQREIPPEVLEQARSIIALGEISSGDFVDVGRFRLFVEKHANGKLGVSVLVQVP